MVGTRSKSKSEAAPPGSCSMCAQPDNQEMVQCDVCDAWFHFICVGVDKEIQNSEWACSKCDGTVTELVESAGAVNQVTTDDEVFQSPMNVNANIIERVGMGRHSVSPGGASGGSMKNRRDVNLQLQRLEEEHKMSMLYIKRKYAIMNTSDDNNGSDDEGGQFNHQQVCQGRTANNVPTDHFDNQEIYTNGNGVANQGASACVNQTYGGQHNPYMNKTHIDNRLTQDQIYARKVTVQELPVFSGKSEEWPLFISCYEHSSRLCGLSNEENLLRLQRALRGKALEYVGSKLILPALVPQVMETLRMLFGRPEDIIRNLITKLRAGPNVNIGKLDTLVHFSLDVRNMVATMEAANLSSHLCNPMLIQELIEKLPPQMRLDWAIQARKLNVVNLSEFSNWLFDLAEAASSVVTISTTSTYDNEKRKPSRVHIHEERPSHDKNKKMHSSELRCYGCDETNHFIAQCAKFKQLEHQKKWAIVNEKNLCRSCLKRHHPRNCRERRECAINNCEAKHHPLLHKSDAVSDDDKNRSVVAVHRMKTSNVLYRIVPITIHGNNTTVNDYAFLDEGSGPTLIEKSMLDELSLKGFRSELCLKWTDGSLRTENESERIDLTISLSGKNQIRHLLKNVRSINKLDLPKQTMIFPELSREYKHLRGLPVESYRNVNPRIIIGLDNRRVAMPLKAKEGRADEPAALKTRLGWTIYGTVGPKAAGATDYSNVSLQLHICECDDDASLNELMKSNMQIENEGVTGKVSCVDDDMRIRNYVRRTGDKFTVKLLWKFNSNLTMPNNYEMAFRRLLCFERKLMRDPDLKRHVDDQIRNMLEKGYIRRLDENEVRMPYPRKWYLPIFAVRNPNKPEKIRMVWDAAAEYRGVSLNQYLEKGPDLVTPLINVLCNFRIGRIGISGDIAEMFHRVAVDTEDVQSQRFLWRSSSEQKPEVYALQVLSFGASCSPSLAQCVKNSNARKFIAEFPRAVESIIKRHYVDDMLDSVDTIPEAIQLARQVRHIHKEGNFHIRNWMSNSKEFLEAMGENSVHKSFCQASRKIQHVVEPEKVLGMWWRTDNDVFTYDLRFTKATDEMLSGRKLPTKRELLRLLMSIFDPLGLLAFYTVQMKILLQNVWRSNTGWDEIIPECFSDEWFRWLYVLKEVERLEIPRCYFQGELGRNSAVQLHVFVDASESAYAAVAYFRIQNQKIVKTSLVCSRTKVAPLRPVSIPRMELLAAVLGARLAKVIISGHDLKIESNHFWTDSSTVLQWLKSDPRRYKQFVMFRIAEIQEITDAQQWSYVPSKENVADLATKFVGKPKFDLENPWFTGPTFLCQSQKNWPKYQHDGRSEVEPSITHVAVQVQENTMFIDYTRFSKWERLLRSMAYVRRFIKTEVLPADKR